MIAMRLKSFAFILFIVAIAAFGEDDKKAPGASKSHAIKDLRLTLLRIEPGEFQMGSPANEPAREKNELQHTVKLTTPFYMQATEVSQAQYQAIMGENPSRFKGAEMPVENVSWEDAVKFCAALSKREGRTFRLPTEAEWEYAARAGKSGPISGSGNIEQMVWHADNSGMDRIDSAKLWDTNPDGYFQKLLDNGCRPRWVGTGTPNDWGLHDMQGNLTEWVSDWYEADYFATDAARNDPQGPAKSSLNSRVMRGGSWGSDPRLCRIAARTWNVPTYKTPSCGFRVVMDPEQAKK